MSGQSSDDLSGHNDSRKKTSAITGTNVPDLAENMWMAKLVPHFSEAERIMFNEEAARATGD